MSQSSIAPNRIRLIKKQHASPDLFQEPKVQPSFYSPFYLAESITREASSQTYATIRYFVDRPLVPQAYRAYAYFRWVDDRVDAERATRTGRLDFLARQQEIIAHCRLGDWPRDLCPEEKLVAELIGNDQTASSGLQTYINQMMAVMVFDAGRRGRFISQRELAEYTRALATAVTEALHYFIGHDDWSPQDESRYLAVTGAHITHMLRDAVEDTAVGYYNIPHEYLNQHNLVAKDVNHEAYRSWVWQRVQLARNCFAQGRTYLAQVENWRCRLAGYAYIARFEVVLDAIAADNYRLRATYPQRKSIKAGLKIILAALRQTIHASRQNKNRLIPSSLPEEMLQ